MADSDQNAVPTATEVAKAVCQIRESKPGLGLKKVITILRDTHGWSISGPRLRKLVAPGDHTSNKNETPKIVAPTLSGVLSNTNIRGLILGPLLTVTDEINAKFWSKNFPGLDLLHVSHGIRKVAWKFILDNNTWIQARFVWDAASLVQPLPSAIYHAMNHDEHAEQALTQAIFVPELFTPEMTRDFHSSVAVNISIGHSQGHAQQVDGAKDKILPVFFAFHPQKFDLFIRDLAQTVEQWGSMTVEANHAYIYKFPRTIPIVVDRIIRGLEQIREVNRVTSASLLKDPIDTVVDFKKIAQTMMSPREIKSEIRAKLLDIYARGTTSMDKREYPEAFLVFLRGFGIYEEFRNSKVPKPKWGSIENNAIENVKVDIYGMAAEAQTRIVSARQSIWSNGFAGPRLMAREIEGSAACTAVSLGLMSLDSSSITDDRRFHGHYRCAVAYSNYGDLMTELETVIPESEHAAILADTAPAWNDAGFCYRSAADHSFHAAHIAGTVAPDVPRDLVDTMHAIRRRACDKLGYDAGEHFAQMHRSGLARLQLPVLGLWEGDPTFCKKWGPHGMMLLALFRQGEGAGGPSAAELKKALAERGLWWVHDEDGNVFLEGKAGAHMNPTWVVPDNTRDGLRAAGLPEAQFEMVRL